MDMDYHNNLRMICSRYKDNLEHIFLSYLLACEDAIVENPLGCTI